MHARDISHYRTPAHVYSVVVMRSSHLVLWVEQRDARLSKRTPGLLGPEHQITPGHLRRRRILSPDLNTQHTASDAAHRSAVTLISARSPSASGPRSAHTETGSERRRQEPRLHASSTSSRPETDPETISSTRSD